MTTYSLEADFEVVLEDPSALEGMGDALMDELLDLEEAGCGIHSASVAVDMGLSVVEVTVSVDAEDDETARRVGESCIRAAIHAIGGGQDLNKPWDIEPKQIVAELVC